MESVTSDNKSRQPRHENLSRDHSQSRQSKIARKKVDSLGEKAQNRDEK